MTRCFYCNRLVWPWQSQGWRYVTDTIVWRWHGRCWQRSGGPHEH